MRPHWPTHPGVWWLTTAMVASSSPATAGGQEPPTLHIKWFVNGGPVNNTIAKGHGAGDNGFSFTGTDIDPGTGIMLSFDLTGAPGSSFNGGLSMHNDLDDTIDVVIEAVLPFKSLPGSTLRGSATVALTTGANGGSVHSGPPYLWQARIDGESVGPQASLFLDPFELSAGGATSAASSALFGTPDRLPGPPIKNSIGFQIGFSLTAGSLAVLESSFAAYPAATTCIGDLNADGLITLPDFFALLEAWGPCPDTSQPCPGDLDGDGLVGILDVMMLFAVWGPCPAN